MKVRCHTTAAELQQGDVVSFDNSHSDPPPLWNVIGVYRGATGVDLRLDSDQGQGTHWVFNHEPVTIWEAG